MVHLFLCIFYTVSLKGKCHKVFDHFLLKVLTWAQMNRQKRFRELFIFGKIFAKNVCSQSQQLHRDSVSVVNDYA